MAHEQAPSTPLEQTATPTVLERSRHRLRKELTGGESVEDLTTWFQDEVVSYVGDHQNFILGYHVEELAKELTAYLARKKGIDFETGQPPIRIDEETTHDADIGMGRSLGTLFLSNRSVLEYVANGEGNGMGVTWNERNLRDALEDLRYY